jgi:hypothetical protein
LYTTVLDTGLSIGADELVVASGTAAYEYARMGFLPDAGDWQTIRSQAMDDLEGKYADMLSSFDDDQQQVIMNLLNNNDEHSLQALIDLPMEYEGRSVGEILLEGADIDMHLDLTDEDTVARMQEYLQ